MKRMNLKIKTSLGLVLQPQHRTKIILKILNFRIFIYNFKKGISLNCYTTNSALSLKKENLQCSRFSWLSKHLQTSLPTFNTLMFCFWLMGIFKIFTHMTTMTVFIVRQKSYFLFVLQYLSKTFLELKLNKNLILNFGFIIFKIFYYYENSILPSMISSLISISSFFI